MRRNREVEFRAMAAHTQPLKGRRAVVTGAGRGIGRDIAQALALAGADVAALARSAAEIERVAGEARSHGVSAVAIPCDVADPAAVKAAIARANDSLGGVDILVNGAGIAPTAPFAKTSDAMFRSVLETNAFGCFYAMREVAPAMVERGFGRIVNVASVAGRKGAAYIAAYSASKHAVLGLTRSAAVEYATSGVTVNAICPGFVETPMLETAVAAVSERTRRTAAEVRAYMAQSSPQNRIFTTAEVSALALFLCSDEARGITGQALGIDGGMTA
jgi:NAD(P)-dependent dehydrogenase (short-subunit alcohol dehydrogenase family)